MWLHHLPGVGQYGPIRGPGGYSGSRCVKKAPQTKKKKIKTDSKNTYKNPKGNSVRNRNLYFILLEKKKRDKKWYVTNSTPPPFSERDGLISHRNIV